jgi:hypothetical protein
LFIALFKFLFFLSIFIPQWCIIFLTLQKSKLISHVSKFGPMLRITPTFLARMLRVWPLFCLLVLSCLSNIGEY